MARRCTALDRKRKKNEKSNFKVHHRKVVLGKVVPATNKKICDYAMGSVPPSLTTPQKSGTWYTCKRVAV